MHQFEFVYTSVTTRPSCTIFSRHNLILKSRRRLFVLRVSRITCTFFFSPFFTERKIGSVNSLVENSSTVNNKGQRKITYRRTVSKAAPLKGELNLMRPVLARKWTLFAAWGGGAYGCCFFGGILPCRAIHVRVWPTFLPTPRLLMPADAHVITFTGILSKAILSLRQLSDLVAVWWRREYFISVL